MARTLFVLSLSLAALFLPPTCASATIPGKADLKNALNPDGTLKKGLEGSFNASGFSMSYAPNGAPVFTPAPFGAGDERWQAMPLQGISNGKVNVITVNSNKVYVGGDFSNFSGINSSARLAMWDESEWHGIAVINDGEVNDIAFTASGDMYVGGSFSHVNFVSNTDGIVLSSGGDWLALGTGIAGTVYDIEVDGTSIYVGGNFTSAGGVANTSRIARWNGTAWSALGTGASSLTVFAVEKIGSTLYIGGQFASVGGVANTGRIAKWNGTVWSALGTGIPSGTVNCFYVSGTNLMVGGNFPSAGGVANTASIARWDGAGWFSIAAGVTGGTVLAIQGSASDLVIGGTFTSTGGVPNTNRIAYWNGTTWAARGNAPLNGDVYAFGSTGLGIIVGGGFTDAGGVTNADRLAYENFGKWHGLGTGIEGTAGGSVGCVAAAAGVVYAGGSFQNASGNSFIARNTGTFWDAMTPALNSNVNVITVSGSNVYVGGIFAAAGGVNANRIAVWNGTIWSALGTGISDGAVDAIAVNGTDVYVGGTFTTAGGSPGNRVAKWNGTTWSALGTGASGFVNALTVLGTSLYAGGSFSSMGGVAGTARIARWTGSAWTSVGTGLNSAVYALANDGTNLYVGGSFSDAGGVANADNIAMWNGSAWSALGTGVSGNVHALAMAGPVLYAAGAFTSAGGVANTQKIAVWNGSSWSALGTGLNADVSGIAVTAGNVYAVGSFLTAVGDESYFAIGIIQRNGVFPSAINVTSEVVSLSEIKLKATIKPGGLAGTYYFQYGTSSGALTSSTNVENSSGTADIPTSVNITSSTPNTTYYYRVRVENAEGVYFSEIKSYTFPPDIELRQGASVVASGGEHDFGSVNFQSSSAPAGFNIHNVGLGNLTFTGTPGSFVVNGGTNPGDFAVVQSSIASPLIYNNNQAFTVQFTPTAGGLRTATLTVNTNDPDEGTYVLNVKGTGVKLDQTISFDPLPLKYYNDPPFILEATATSGLSVSFDSDNHAVATISGNVVTIVGPGQTRVTALQGGNGGYNAAPQKQYFLNVAPAEPNAQPTALTFPSLGNSTISWSFTAVSPSPSGYIVFYDLQPITAVPVDGTGYITGSTVDATTKVAHVGPETAWTVASLTPGTVYHFAIFAYNGSSATSNFLTMSPLTGQKLTFPAAPSPKIVTSVTSNYFKAEWTPAASAIHYLLDVATDQAFTSFVTGYQSKLVTGEFHDVTGLNADTQYFFRLRTVNATGESFNSSFISVRTLVDTGGSQPITFGDLTIGASQVSVNVTGGTSDRKIKFFYKGILAPSTEWKSPEITAASGNTFTKSISTSDLDDMGLEFYFEGDDSSSDPVRHPLSGNAYIYRSIAPNEKSIPFAPGFDGEQKTFQMFSIPYVLENADVASIFDVKLDGKDITQWRLFHYENKTLGEYPSQFVSLEHGKGYWFNTVRKNFQIPLGPGTVVNRNQVSNFTMTLNPGWNQVGNPYPFNISWTTVRSSHLDVGELVFWSNGSYSKRDVFKPWEGAFVFNSSSSPVTLSIPVSARTTSGRIYGTELPPDIDQDAWKVEIEISAAGLATVSGVGMHPEANQSKDRFDEITLPHFTDYAVFDSNHPEFFAPEFAVDVVPTTNSATWLFDVRSNLEGELVEMKWDHHVLQRSGSALIMIDRLSNTWVDMKTRGQFSFSHREGRQLNILYSRSGDITPDVTMLGDAYPNAFTSEVFIPVLVTREDLNVQIEVFDMTGRRVKVLNEALLKPGMHSLRWDGKDDQDNPIGGGIYLYRLLNSNTAKRIVKQ